MDNTMVFSNASIWVFQQMFESLYEVTPDGKDVQPLLAESHTALRRQADLDLHAQAGREVQQRRSR